MREVPNTVAISRCDADTAAEIEYLLTDSLGVSKQLLTGRWDRNRVCFIINGNIDVLIPGTEEPVALSGDEEQTDIVSDDKNHPQFIMFIF